jgi:hypothetical protein
MGIRNYKKSHMFSKEKRSNFIMQIDVIKCREEGHDSPGRIEQVAEQTMPGWSIKPKGFQKHLDHVY